MLNDKKIGIRLILIALFGVTLFIVWRIGHSPFPPDITIGQTPPPPGPSNVPLEIISPTPASQESQASIDTGNWQTYVNKKYGFEMKLPPQLEVFEYPRNQSYPALNIYIADVPGTHPNQFVLDILVFNNAKNLPLRDWYKETLNGKEFDYTDMAPKVIEPDYNLWSGEISGRNVLKIETRLPKSSYWVKRYFVEVNGHIVGLRANSIEGHSVTGTETGILLDQVMTSLKSIPR